MALIALGASGLAQNPASWTFKANKINSQEYELLFKVDIAPGYHMYGLEEIADGPLPLKFDFKTDASYQLVGSPVADVDTKEEYDDGFELNVKYYDGSVTFTQKIKLNSADAGVVAGTVSFQTCTDGQCIPGDADFSFNLGENTAVNASTTATAGAEDTDGGQSWIVFFFVALFTGLLSVITPCVFPMIPMIVSFFMTGSDKKLVCITKGLIFGLSITMVYTLIGVIVALTQNASLAAALSTNWIPNLIFFLLFIAFALSFFGLYEITLPTGLANKADKQVDKGGYMASFFLAVVLAIVSFSCTGPFVGTLLVKASLDGIAAKPIVGMFGFGLGLGLPFMVFAFTPSLLKKLPKSGGWLNAVKVVFAFVMVGFSMKFLDIVDTDLGWGLITRDAFIAVWIVLAILLGLYIMGKIKFSHDSDVPHLSVFRLLIVIISFSFAVYLVPGLFGAPLASMSAFMPAQDKQVFDLTKHETTPEIIASSTGMQIGMFNQLINEPSGQLCGTPKYADFLSLPKGVNGYFDLKEGLACAKKQGKPVFLDFKGHRCSNCKKMDKEVFADKRVVDMLNTHFVVIGLYTDDDTLLPEAEWTKNAKGKDLKTIGAKNQAYEAEKYSQVAQPYFIVIDHNENILSKKGMGYVSDPDEFLKWLQEVLDSQKK